MSYKMTEGKSTHPLIIPQIFWLK